MVYKTLGEVAGPLLPASKEATPWDYFIFVCRFNIRPRYFIIFVVVFSALYNVPRFFEYRTQVRDVQIPSPCPLDPQVGI